MTRQSRNLLVAIVSTSALALSTAPGFALDLPQAFKYDMGPFGNWTVSGGVEAALSGWNNSIPRSADRAPGVGDDTSGDVDLTNAIFILNSKGNMFGNFPLQFHAWVGEPPQTPVVGYTSPNVAPNLYSTEGNGLNGTGHASFLFKGWATYQPLDWFSIEGGRLPSVDGTEIGVGFLNQLPALTDLNNMQTTVADGAQVNFIAGADNSFYYGFVPGYGSTLTIRVADGYKTGHMNELGMLGLWNLTPDGSDFIIGYGHTRLSVVGGNSTATSVGPGLNGTNPFAVGNFGLWNSDLIGFGTVYNLTNRLSVNAEVETAWLPKSAIPTALRCTAATCGGDTNQDYYRYSTQVTLAYDFGIHKMFGEPIRTSYAVQEEYTYQHGNKSDPNGNLFGNYLGLGAGASPTNAAGTASTGSYGTFGVGSSMWGFQTGPTLQYHNAYVRPTFIWTHLTDTAPGFAYGHSGNQHDQFVVMLDLGFLLGKFEESDTGQ